MDYWGGGGAKGMLAPPLQNYWGGLAPPLPTPVLLALTPPPAPTPVTVQKLFLYLYSYRRAKNCDKLLAFVKEILIEKDF